jgi:hypothetical protein
MTLGIMIGLWIGLAILAAYLEYDRVRLTEKQGHIGGKP